MSFALPSVKPKVEFGQQPEFDNGQFGVPDLMKTGLSASINRNAHPLMQSERNYGKNRHNLNMVILRNTQGLHAPLRIAMEHKAAQKVGRLPFLPSSNIMLDSLTGRDIEIGPEDIFNTPEFCESMGQPHAVVEKNLGIL